MRAKAELRFPSKTYYPQRYSPVFLQSQRRYSTHLAYCLVMPGKESSVAILGIILYLLI